MTKTSKKKPIGRPVKSEVVPSTKAAATILERSARTLRNYRAQDCPGFNSDGTVDVAKVRAWMEKHEVERDGSSDSKEKKRLEEIRKLRLANDQKEGRLVEIAWVVSRYQISAGAIRKLREKSEAEDATRFAATGGDVAACRDVVCGIWDGIIAGLQQELARPFEEAESK